MKPLRALFLSRCLAGNQPTITASTRTAREKPRAGSFRSFQYLPRAYNNPRTLHASLHGADGAKLTSNPLNQSDLAASLMGEHTYRLLLFPSCLAPVVFDESLLTGVTYGMFAQRNPRASVHFSAGNAACTRRRTRSEQVSAYSRRFAFSAQVGGSCVTWLIPNASRGSVLRKKI